MSAKKQENTLRLVRLLNVYGTAALRNEFDAKFPPASLATSLSSLPLTNALQALLTKGVLKLSQWEKLYPSSGVPDSKNFDISLLYLLLRNICGFTKPQHPVWTKPGVRNTSVEANIARVRGYRNYMIHDEAAGVDDATFQKYWADVTLVLKRLGIPQAELDALKDSSLDEEMYENLLLQWKREEEELKEKLEGFNQMLKKEEGVKKLVLESGKEHQEDQRKLMEALDELKQEGKQTRSQVEQVQESNENILAEMKSSRDASEKEVLKKLVKINFQQEQEFQAKKCHPGTREWLFEEVENWFRDEESESRVMIILANAGMGKTVAAATVCQKMQTSGNLGGVHFCKHGIARYRNAKTMLQSLASSLCDVLPGYKAELVKQLSHNLGEENDLNKMDVEELFCFLLQEPLGQVCPPEEPLMFVIDALDEAEYHGRNELMEVIASYFARLPSWLKFLVTSRPGDNAKSKLADLHPVEIAPDLEKNLEDIELFLREKLPPLVPADKLDTVLSLCIEKSQGLMLYACCTIEFLSKRKEILWEKFDSILPDSISSWYKDYGNRLKKDLGVTDAIFSRFLAALVSSREALPLEIIPLLLKFPVDSASADSDELVLRAIEAVSLLLPLHDGKIDVFHKSFTDWLTEPQMHPSKSKQKSRVTEEQGHQVLAEVCGQILESLRNREDLPEEFSLSESYALKHGTSHVLQSGKHEKHSRDVFFGLEVLILKLLEGSVYEVIEEYNCYEDAVFPNVKDIRHILKLNSSFLLVRPLNILDHIVNEAGCERLQSEARELLGKKKFEHLWMEVLCRKGERKPHILAEMEIKKPIHDVDVSPDCKTVVVSAIGVGSDGLPTELCLWRIMSGEFIWRRDIYVSTSTYVPCCRFSPDGSLILFGKLDLACHLDGEIKPYFDGTDHEFIECQFSSDGRRLVTLPEERHKLKLWDLNKQQHLVDILLPCFTISCPRCIFSEVEEFQIMRFKFSHCGQYIAAANQEVGICLWDSRAGEELEGITFFDDYNTPEDEIKCFDWVCTPSDEMLVVQIGQDGQGWNQYTYKVSSSKLIQVKEYRGVGLELFFSIDGKHATAVIQRDDANVKQELESCFFEGVTYIYALDPLWDTKYIPIDERLAIASHGGTVLVLSTHSVGQVTLDNCIPQHTYLELCGNKLYVDHGMYHVFAYDICEAGNLKTGTERKARGMQVLSDNKIIIYNRNYNGSDFDYEIWDGGLANLLWTWESGLQDTPLCADDGIGVITSNATGDVYIRNTQTGKVKCVLEGSDKQATWGCVDPSNSRLLTATCDTLYLWNLKSWTLHSFHEVATSDGSIAPDKQLVAVLLHDRYCVAVLNETSGEFIKEIDIHRVRYIRFTHGGHLACVGSTGLFLVDVEKSQKVAVARLMQPASSSVKPGYDPHSRRLAVAFDDQVSVLKIHSSSF